MWISSAVFESLVADRAKAEGKSHAQELEVVALKGTMEWMIVRLNQLEHERAVMIQQYMGVRIAAPSIESTRSEVESATFMNTSADLFSDVGDAEANRLGLGWNDQGEMTSALTRKN